MRSSARVEPCWDSGAWRAQARIALRADIAPEQLDWIEGDGDSLLVAPDIAQAPRATADARVSPALLTLAETVACHREPQRFAQLYLLLWRMTHGEPRVLSNPADPLVHGLHALAQSVRRDAHKMKAFVRFREVPGEDNRFVAWFEPEHRIVDHVAPFFARRFTGMQWAILTPYRSALWDGAQLRFAAGAVRADAPAEDAQEALWRAYYAHIFNPARLNPRMMKQEMPVKYWRHLPEAQLLPTLVREAGSRVQQMAQRAHEAPRRRIPAPSVAPATQHAPAQSLAQLRAAAAACRACPLWEAATGTVFGEGPDNARILIIGEQPGDREDLSGRPFVGPAGQLLDRALAELGLSREALYLTNAVKHFRFERRGKTRLHRNPEAAHVQACRPWLAGEIEQIRPQVIVCLGATAALALFGADFRLMAQRGTWHTLHDGTRAFATVHPAWILRQRDPAEREAAYRAWLGDLRLLVDEAVSIAAS